MTKDSLDLELDHIFESGANQERIKALISKNEVYAVLLIFKAEKDYVYVGIDKQKAERLAIENKEYNTNIETWQNGQYKKCAYYVKGILKVPDATIYPF